VAGAGISEGLGSGHGESEDGLQMTATVILSEAKDPE
jgi:hypothetical protein